MIGRSHKTGHILTDENENENENEGRERDAEIDCLDYSI
jgi:hypothetical protein